MAWKLNIAWLGGVGGGGILTHLWVHVARRWRMVRMRHMRSDQDRLDGARPKGSRAIQRNCRPQPPNTPVVGNQRLPPRRDRAPVRCGGARTSRVEAERERSGSGAGAKPAYEPPNPDLKPKAKCLALS